MSDVVDGGSAVGGTSIGLVRAAHVVFWSSFAVVVVWLVAASLAVVAAIPPLHDAFHRGGPVTQQVSISRDEFGDLVDEHGSLVSELVVRAGDEVTVTLAGELDPGGTPLALYPSQEGSTAALTTAREGNAHRFRAPEAGSYLLQSDRSDALTLPVHVVERAEVASLTVPPALATAFQQAASLSHFAPALQGAGVQYLFSLMELALAVFLIRVRPRDPAAWLLCLGLLGTAAVFNLPAHAAYFTLEPLVGTGVVEAVHAWGFHLIGGAAYVGALLVFPDGRLPRWSLPRSQRVIVRVLYLALFMGVSWFVAFQVTILAEEPLGRLGFFGVLIPVVGILAQVVRYRYAANETQRQQSRVLTVALGAALAVTLLIGAILWTLARSGPSPALDLVDRLGFEVFPPLFAVIPVVLVAVLVRYRLWEMDRVLNRALVYSVVSAILGIGYLVIVVLLGPYVPGGQSSPLAVAVATLALAGLFRPLRSRIQVAVDRRFYRQRYDAAKSIGAFSARLREQVDLDTLTTELIAVVDDTVAPVTSFLWLRPLEEQRSEGATP